MRALYDQGYESVAHRTDFFRFGSLDMLMPMLEGGNLLLAEDESGHAAGMVSVITAMDWWYFVGLVVDEQHRGNGVAGELLRAAKAFGEKRGAVRGVTTAPSDLVEFYSKNGFKPVATVMEYA